MKIVLASGSRYRAALLEKLQLRFSQQTSNVDESHRIGETPKARALRLSIAKAKAVALQVEQPALVIGSDQVAHLNNVIFDKPGSAEHAIAQLTRSSGQQVQFETGCCVYNSVSHRYHAKVDTVTVTFKELDPIWIDHYVRREQPMDCAGSFKAEGLGICLFDRIDSQDPNTLIGLSLITLTQFLINEGVNPLLGSG